MRKITINIGFITNSSSCIHYFDKRVLENEEVKAFIEAYGIQDGYVGKNLWHRGQCGSFVVTGEQRREVQKRFSDPEYSSYSPGLTLDANQVILIYGDEHPEITYELCDLLRDVCEKLKFGDYGSHSYN